MPDEEDDEECEWSFGGPLGDEEPDEAPVPWEPGDGQPTGAGVLLLLSEPEDRPVRPSPTPTGAPLSPVGAAVRPSFEEHTMLHTLRNALPIVAAALGRKLGVEVGVGGHEACTDGRHIQIPDIPDDPVSRDLAWGYLAHEAGHVRYTDFAVYTLAAREGPLQEILQNRIEDVRIERALARPYPGTRSTIAAVLRRMLAEGRLAAPAPTDHPAQVLAAYLLLALRHEVLGQTVLAEEARKAADTLAQVFPAPFIARLRTMHGRGARADQHGGSRRPGQAHPASGRG